MSKEYEGIQLSGATYNEIVENMLLDYVGAYYTEHSLETVEDLLKVDITTLPAYSPLFFAENVMNELGYTPMDVVEHLKGQKGESTLEENTKGQKYDLEWFETQPIEIIRVAVEHTHNTLVLTHKKEEDSRTITPSTLTKMFLQYFELDVDEEQYSLIYDLMGIYYTINDIKNYEYLGEYEYELMHEAFLPVYYDVYQFLSGSLEYVKKLRYLVNCDKKNYGIDKVRAIEDYALYLDVAGDCTIQTTENYDNVQQVLKKVFVFPMFAH